MQFAPDPQHAVVRAALLATVPDLHRFCRGPWTVIGSAAAYMAGAAVTVADLDVLTSVRDAQTMTEHWRAQRDFDYKPADSARFRSHLARFHFGELPVEVIGGLELSGAQGWVPVRIGARAFVDIDGLSVPIPTIAEQIRVLESFARPKDFQRVALLKALPQAPR